MARKANRWATDHDRCRHCGTTDRRHRARGLCGRCYNESLNQKYRQPDAKPGARPADQRIQISEPQLQKLYVQRRLSLQEIADLYGCTKVFIQYLMKRYRIPRRNRSDARRLALRQRKIRYTLRGSDGRLRTVEHQRTTLNCEFFRHWTPEMAYVLGVFYTDGCVSKCRAGSYTASVAQKEPELLEKCLALMKCNARLIHRPNGPVGRMIYAFALHDQGVCRDLIRLGVHPRKSLTLEFPSAPFRVLRHFIRGCWDGDGSISKSGNVPSAWRASYVSASPKFIRSLVECLVAHGLPPVRIHSRRNSRALKFCYSGTRCATLFDILYEGVPESQYLMRKFVRFRDAAADTSGRTTPLPSRR
jgi:hypothetical protein